MACDEQNSGWDLIAGGVEFATSWRHLRHAAVWLALCVGCSHPAAGSNQSDAASGTQSGLQSTHNYTAGTDTVTDNVTHLIWQRAVPASYAGCAGPSGAPGVTCTWTEASAYCGNAELATALGGTGWRLPTKTELESIVDLTQRPTIDPVVFPATPSDFFWSATPYEGQSGYAWVVFFSDGNSGSGDDSYNYHVRCVR